MQMQRQEIITSRLPPAQECSLGDFLISHPLWHLVKAPQSRDIRNSFDVKSQDREHGRCLARATRVGKLMKFNRSLQSLVLTSPIRGFRRLSSKNKSRARR